MITVNVVFQFRHTVPRNLPLPALVKDDGARGGMTSSTAAEQTDIAAGVYRSVLIGRRGRIQHTQVMQSQLIKGAIVRVCAIFRRLRRVNSNRFVDGLI